MMTILSKSRPIAEKIASNLCDSIVSTAHCFHQNTSFFLILCTIHTDDTFTRSNTWHTTGVCFITSFNRICHCRYFFITFWKNWSKNKRWSSEMRKRMEKFNVKVKVLYISILNFCACALVSGIPQTHVTQKM